MSKEEIEQHPAWKQILKLSPKDRYYVLLGRMQLDIENSLGVRIESRPYTDLPNIGEDQLALAVTDSFSNYACLAVVSPIRNRP
jgi:hypothetical protein